MCSKRLSILGVLILQLSGLAGCKSDVATRVADGPIELPCVVDGAMPYQANPFRRTVEDLQLFKDEAPCILITHDSNASPVHKWRTQSLLIPKAGPGEVTYDLITVQAHYETHSESTGHFSAEHIWSTDVNGDGVPDVLVLGWYWGGPGWFEGDPETAPQNEPASLRVIIREATDKGHPLGIESDQRYKTAQLRESGVTGEHLRAAVTSCDDPIWIRRLRTVEEALKD